MHASLLSTSVVALLLASPLAAKTIDLRNSTDADGGLREISFCARPSPSQSGFPGHAFVSFATIGTGQLFTFRAIGHTVLGTGDAILSYGGFIPATGALVAEQYTSIKQECLTVQINATEFDAIYAKANQPLKSLGITLDESKPIQRTYSLAAEDCVQFMVSIAKEFSGKGLKIPTRNSTDLPIAYIRRLINSN